MELIVKIGAGIAYLVILAAGAEWAGENWGIISGVAIALAGLVAPIMLWERITKNP